MTSTGTTSGAAAPGEIPGEMLWLGSKGRTSYSIRRQEAQLPQSDRATRYASKFVLFYEVWELERFQTAKVTYKVIQAPRYHISQNLKRSRDPEHVPIINALVHLCIDQHTTF